MLFSGIPFLYYFLPAVLLVYFAVPQRGRNAVLLLASLAFYGWGEPHYLALMLASIVLFYAYGRAIGAAASTRVKKGILIAAVLTGILELGVFKYADFFLSGISAVTGLQIPLLRLALPIGISFYTFQCISYAVDVYRGDAAPQKDLIAFGTYVAMFPQLIAGPIVRYTQIAPALTERRTHWEDAAYGARRFLIGLGKKVLLANSFGAFVSAFRESAAPSILFCWGYAAAFLMQVYFDFSGYSDMAIGLGRVFGFSFPENFRYPYLAKSITEFWRRWHISLGSWFRDYAYIPLGGNRVPKARWVLNILLVWMLTGLWHGAAWNFVLWGLFFAIMLLLEKRIPALTRLPDALRHGYVLLAVLLSFVLFNAESMAQAGADFAGMFGLARLPAVTGETLYQLRSHAVLFLTGTAAATPFPAKLWNRLPARMAAAIEPLLLLALLLLCTAYLADGSYNPFLYFRF